MSLPEELDDTSPILLPLEHAGEIVLCQRCSVPCLVAAVKDTTARLFQAADGDGQCTACIVADFFQGEMDISYLLPEGTDPRDALRMPHIQEQLARIMKVGRSQLAIEEIDWEAVIAKWELPLVTRKRKRKR